MTQEIIERALAPITQAQRMLSEAVTFEDFRNLRDVAETARAWARARGMGLDAENTAAEYILRAERGMGKTLIELNGAKQYGRGAAARAAQERRRGKTDVPSVLSPADLGLNEQSSMLFQRLADKWSDEEFEQFIAYCKARPGARLSKVDFYRGPKAEAKRDRSVVADAAEAEAEEAGVAESPMFTAFRKASMTLIEDMSQLPTHELAEVAGLIQRLAFIYSSVRADRS